MNQQNMCKTNSSAGTDVPVKRKRGRPRKDETMLRSEKRQTQQTSLPVSQPPHISTIPNIQQPSNPIGYPNNKNPEETHSVVGQVVTGVIDGVFDAGYLISVRVGPNNAPLRGLVFQQGNFCPITPSNDIAPHLKMCRRENIQIPISNQTTCAKQSPQLAMQNYQTTPPMAGPSCNSAPPHENLRMVEQDELMQVFEVSKMVEQQQQQQPPQQQQQEEPKSDDCGQALKNDNFLSDSDLMPDSLRRNDAVKHPSLDCGGHEISGENVTEEMHNKTQQEVENPENITRVDTVIEEPSIGEDLLKHECEKQGEVKTIDVNQDPNQAVPANLF